MWAALLCTSVALLAPTRASNLPDLGPDTNPRCVNISQSCADSITPQKFVGLLSYLMNGDTAGGQVEARKIISKQFQDCMGVDDSCCCCDEDLKAAFKTYIEETASSFKSFMPDDIDTDPMQCSHRTGGSGPYTCGAQGAACPVQSCSDADPSFQCASNAVRDDANHCSAATCTSSDFGAAGSRCCSAPGSCKDASGSCTSDAVRYDSGKCAKPTCGPSDFGNATANCCQPPPQKCNATGFTGECTGGAVKDDKGFCDTHTCGASDFGTADANCCTKPQSCDASSSQFDCSAGTYKDPSATCAGAVCQAADFGLAGTNCCTDFQSCGAADASLQCTGGAVRNGMAKCKTGTCGPSDFGGDDTQCCRPPPQSCSASGAFAGQCTNGAVKDDSAKCPTTCDAGDFGGSDKSCCTNPQSCGANGVKGECTNGAVRDDAGTCLGAVCGAADFGGADTRCCIYHESCSAASANFTCGKDFLLDDAGICAQPECKKSDFRKDGSCCTAAPIFGWRVKVNATWTDTHCDKVMNLIPVLKGYPELKELATLVKDDSVSCVDFGECVGTKCESSILFMTDDQEASEKMVESLLDSATKYNTVPSDIQNMQKIITSGNLAGFAAPSGLLCIDNDCKTRMKDMSDTCKACTCIGDNGESSPCEVKIDVEAIHSGLTVAAFTDLKNAAASFAGVDEAMVSFTLAEVGKISMSVWLEDPSDAAMLSVKVIDDVEKGQKSELSRSIAEAVKEQNKVNGIRVANVKTSAPGASKSEFKNSLPKVGGDVEDSDRSSSSDKTDVNTTGIIIAVVVGVVIALGIGGLWLFWAQKKKKSGKSMGGKDSDFAIGVLESGSGHGTTQMTEIRGKRVSMANPLNGSVSTSQVSREDGGSELNSDMKQQGWASAVDDEGDLYFYNHKQGVSTYDMPIYKDGVWVAQSDDEDDDEDSETDTTEQQAAQAAKKKPSLLISNTLKFNSTTNNRVMGKKSKSMAVAQTINKKQHSLGGLKKTGDKRIINKRSQSLAANVSRKQASDSRWERKNRILSQPAIPIMKEEEEEEEDMLVLTPAMKKSGWKAATDDEGDEYFYNHDRGESTYELPVLKEGTYVAPSDDDDDEED